MAEFGALQLVNFKKHLSAFNDKSFMTEDLRRRPRGHYFNLHGMASKEELQITWNFALGGAALHFPDDPD